MADGTKIEWTDATVNAVNGCSVLSPGCKLCYAMKQAHRFDARRGLTRMTAGGMVWTGEVRLNETQLLKPLAWKRARRIFWNAHGDLFHESVPDAWIDKVFAICALTPQHSHQILTKRSARMRAYMAKVVAGDRFVTDEIARIMAPLGEHGYDTTRLSGAERERLLAANARVHAGPLPNVWLGVSVEDQQRADERIPDLLATPAAVRFISAEPLLGPVDLTHITLRGNGGRPTELSQRLGDYVQPLRGNFTDSPKLNWVIVGGESGSGARPMHPDWARSLRDQCAAAGVPFLFKQWGLFTPSGPGCLPVDYRDCAGAVAWPDGEVTLQGGDPAAHGGAGQHMFRATKAVAGRLLDGVQHDGMPA